MERPRYTPTNEVAAELRIRERSLIAELRSTMLLRHTLEGLTVPNRLVIDLQEPTPPTEPASGPIPMEQRPVDLDAFRRSQQAMQQQDHHAMKVDEGYGMVLAPESISAPVTPSAVWQERQRKMR